MPRRKNTNFLQISALASTRGTEFNEVKLQINYDNTARLGNLSIRTLLLLKGFDTLQSIILLIPPNAITSIDLYRPPLPFISPQTLSRIPTITNQKDIGLLSLKLNQPGNIICPRPKDSDFHLPATVSDTRSYERVTQLARTNRLEVLCNYGKMASTEQALLQGFIALFAELNNPPINLRHRIFATATIFQLAPPPSYEQSSPHHARDAVAEATEDDAEEDGGVGVDREGGDGGRLT